MAAPRAASAASAASTVSPVYWTSTPMAGGRSADRLCRYTVVSPSYLATRRSSSFSPIFADSALISSATVPVPRSVVSTASTVAPAACWATTLTTRSASSWNSEFLATKSVSQSSSARAPPTAATRPFAVVRSARLPMSFAPLMRRLSTALAKSPSDSSRARMQSIIPAPVSSRSRLTSAALVAMVGSVPCLLVEVGADDAGLLVRDDLGDAVGGVGLDLEYRGGTFVGLGQHGRFVTGRNLGD